MALNPRLFQGPHSGLRWNLRSATQQQAPLCAEQALASPGLRFAPLPPELGVSEAPQLGGEEIKHPAWAGGQWAPQALGSAEALRVSPPLLPPGCCGSLQEGRGVET